MKAIRLDGFYFFVFSSFCILTNASSFRQAGRLLTGSDAAAAGGRYRRHLSRKKHEHCDALQASKATMFLTVIAVGLSPTKEVNH